MNSWFCSTTANLPLDSWTVPVNLPLTVSPSFAARNGALWSRPSVRRSERCRARAAWREDCADRAYRRSADGWRRHGRYDAHGNGRPHRGPAGQNRMAQGRTSRPTQAVGRARSNHPRQSAFPGRRSRGRGYWPAGASGVIGSGAALEFHRVDDAVDGTIQVHPSTTNLHIGLIDMPFTGDSAGRAAADSAPDKSVRRT